jgi:hypothetical protein
MPRYSMDPCGVTLKGLEIGERDDGEVRFDSNININTAANSKEVRRGHISARALAYGVCIAQK